MKILKYVLFCIVMLALPLLIVSTNLRFTVNNIAVYKYIIQNYKIDRVTGIDNAQLTKVYQHWIDYYNSGADTPQIQVTKNGREINLLSDKEIVHLQDVKGLMDLDYAIQVTTTLVLIACAAAFIWALRNTRFLLKSIFAGAALTFGLGLLLSVAAVLSFDRLFVLFHELSFANSFWILDPTRDYLIMMFPGGFFSDISIVLFIAIMAESAAIGALSFWGWKQIGKTGTAKQH
jgi:integral membrane protein (TIGR01906 family)